MFSKLFISFDASRGTGKKISRKGHVLNFPPKVVNIGLKENSKTNLTTSKKEIYGQKASSVLLLSYKNK